MVNGNTHMHTLNYELLISIICITHPYTYRC